MGVKYEVETVGELRLALTTMPADLPLQLLIDGADYGKLELQACYEKEPEGFLRITVPD
jgi:hypothetical protein